MPPDDQFENMSIKLNWVKDVLWIEERLKKFKSQIMVYILYATND
jgi:hypothetical protein